MTKGKSTILLAAMLGGLLLAAAGCGGSNSAANTSPTTTETMPTTTTDTTSTSGLGNLASAANCNQLAGLGAKFAAAFTGQTRNIQAESTLLRQFADRTPTDIRPDFEVLASAYAKIATALQGVNLSSGKPPTAAQIAKLQQLSSQIDQAAVQRASQHIGIWAAQNCHA